VRGQYQIPDDSMMVGLNTVQPARTLRDLCVHIDSHLSMWTNVTSTASTCFAVLCQSVFQYLIVSLVLSSLDYGGATLACLLACLLERLQSVLNAEAQLVFGSRNYDYVTPLLHDLHCLVFRKVPRLDLRCWFTVGSMNWHNRTLLMNFHVWLTLSSTVAVICIDNDASCSQYFPLDNWLPCLSCCRG